MKIRDQFGREVNGELVKETPKCYLMQFDRGDGKLVSSYFPKKHYSVIQEIKQE